MLVSYSFSIAKRCLVSWNSRTKKKETPSLDRYKGSPPSPLRMERGVDSIVCKQRGRFFTSKRRPFHGKETPSSKRRRRLFVFSSTIPANEGQLCNTETIWYIAFSKPLLQTEVITILNCELWILNYTWASASVESRVPLGTLCRLAASCHPCILCQKCPSKKLIDAFQQQN